MKPPEAPTGHDEQAPESAPTKPPEATDATATGLEAPPEPDVPHQHFETAESEATPASEAEPGPAATSGPVVPEPEAAARPEAPPAAEAAELEAVPAPEAPPARIAPGSVPPEPAAPRAGWWARQIPQNTREPFGFILRAMAYEVLVVLVTAVAIAVLAFVALQGRFQDFYLKLRPHAPVSGEVALLTIGPEAFYLWDPSDPTPSETPRALLAELVRFLDAAGTSVIVLDLLLDQPREGDEALAAAARAHGRVVAAERLVVTEPSSGREFVAGVSPTLLGAMYSGYANFQAEQSTLFSGDLLVRRVPLVRLADRSHLMGPWPGNLVGGQQDIDQVVPALSLVATTLHRRGAVPPDQLARELQSGCSGTPMRCALSAEDLGLLPLPHPLHEPLSINFRGPEHADGLPTVTAARALRVNAQAALLRGLGVGADIEVPADVRALLADRVVVVGRVDHDAGDRFFTPFAMPVPIEPDMAGPRIHAQIVDTLIRGSHIRSPSPLLAWGLGLLGALAVLAAWRRMSDHVLGALVVGLSAALFVLGVVVFDVTDGLALDLGPPLLGLLATLFLLTLRGWILDNASRG